MIPDLSKPNRPTPEQMKMQRITGICSLAISLFQSQFGRTLDVEVNAPGLAEHSICSAKILYEELDKFVEGERNAENNRH